MCGLSAVLRFGRAQDKDPQALKQLHALQRHRGPDGEGAFTVDAALRGQRHAAPPPGGTYQHMLAVRRLRVADLAASADQPLVSADGRMCVALNGAIFNYRELTQELRALGAQFRTQGDTEVVLHAWRAWGTDCFARFNGMWAILIFDLETGQLVMSRDRMGIKPLYYAVESGRLLLASEPQAIARVIGPRAEPARIVEFLSGYPARTSALSYFQDVHPVPAGSWAQVELRAPTAGTPQFREYWRLADYHPGAGGKVPSEQDAAAQFRELLTSSVAAQSLADVKVGSLLSGGMDTSTIVGLWATIEQVRHSTPPQTYSIAWDDPAMSERPYQEAVTAKSGAKGHILQLNPDDVWNGVDRTIAGIGQPLLGQEMIAQNYAFAFARADGAVVLLDGSGADETQAGLAHYEAGMVYERMIRRQYMTVMRELFAISRSYDLGLRQTLGTYVVSPIRDQRIQGLPQHHWLDEQVARKSLAWRSSIQADAGGDHSHLNALLYRETRHTNIPAVLMQTDRNAMSHGIEVRLPLLDHRLVELLFSLPAAYKVGFGRRKKLLRETAKDVLPASIMARKDKKYFVLQRDWMQLRERHAGAIRDAAYSEVLERLPGIRKQMTRQFVDAYLAGRHDNAFAVWRIFTAVRWAEQFGL